MLFTTLAGRSLVLILLLAALAPAQLIGGFDVQTVPAGSFVPVSTTPGGDPEGWLSVSGTQVIANLATGTTPCAIPLDGTTQWCEVNQNLTGPASPVVPAGGPSGWPYMAGSVSEMRIMTTVPVFASGSTGIVFDYYWSSAEAPSSPTFNDFIEVSLVDTTNMTLLENVFFRDTFPPSPQSPGVNTCPSLLTSLAYLNTFSGTGQGDTGVTFSHIIQNPALLGAPVTLVVIAANQGDGSCDGSFFIDNIRWVDGSTLTPPFTLVASTSGGGVGDLSFGALNVPLTASHVNILISGTPAAGGLGTGLAFGLTPDSLLIQTLFEPAVAGSFTHYPASADPYLAGPINLPAGTLSALAGQTWEAVALAYNLLPGGGLIAMSNYGQMVW